LLLSNREPLAFPLSAVIVSFNEEKKISDCLKSVQFADEVLVVDSFSTDKTEEICHSFGARFLNKKWLGYVQQKNFAANQSTHEWVLSIDSDERCSPSLKKEIQNILRNPETAEAGFSIPRKVFYINRWIRNGGWYPARKVRLFQKKLARWEGEDPHDRVEVDGKCGKLTGEIYHFSFDNISSHFQTINNFTTVAAKEKIAKGRRTNIIGILLRPYSMFFKMFLLKTGFFDGMPGFIIAVLSWFHVFSKYVKIWELQKTRSQV